MWKDLEADLAEVFAEAGESGCGPRLAYRELTRVIATRPIDRRPNPLRDAGAARGRATKSAAAAARHGVMLRAIERGAGRAEAAEEAGLSLAYANQVARKHGVWLRRPRTAAETAAILRALGSGERGTVVARRAGLSSDAVHSIASRARKRGLL